VKSSKRESITWLGKMPTRLSHALLTDEISMESDMISMENGITDEEGLLSEESICDQDLTQCAPPTRASNDLSFFSRWPTSPWVSYRDKEILSSSSWESECTEMKFTMASNLAFLLGASMQTYTSIVDFIDVKNDAMEDDDDNYDGHMSYTLSDKMYYVFYSLGPFFYIINFIIDVFWLMSRTGSLSSLTFQFPFIHFESNEFPTQVEYPEQQADYRRVTEVDMNICQDSDSFDDESRCSTIESSAGSFDQTNIAWEIAALIFFGLGAFLEFYGTLLDDYFAGEDGKDDDAYLINLEEKSTWYTSYYKIEFLGMHFYLLNGLIMLMSQRNSYRSGFQFGGCRSKHIFSQEYNGEAVNIYMESTNPMESSNRLAQFFMFLGVILFVCGTLMDCSIAWLSDPEIRKDFGLNTKFVSDLNRVTLSTFDLISSLLWNIDAVLYICADFLLYSLHKKNSKRRK